MGQLDKTTEEINRHFTEVEEFMAETPGKKAEATGAEVFNDYSGNKATGQYSHAENCANIASGDSSHAGGYGSVSDGRASFAHGIGISTTLDCETAFGMWNATGPRTRFAVGIGTEDDYRKNALEVTSSGNTYLYGVGGYDGTNADTAVPVNQLDQPSRGTENMNECLKTGFYPWCTLGRPAGSAGAFSLAVRRSTTPDFQGYYTVHQTAFGREAELGQVWTRMVFDKGGSASPETDYMEWIRVDGAGGEATAEPLAVRAKIGRSGGIVPVVKVELNRELAEDEEIHLFRMTRAGRSSGTGENITGHVTAYTDLSAWDGSGPENDPNLLLKAETIRGMSWLKDTTKSVNGRHQYILMYDGIAFTDFNCFLNVSRKDEGFAVIQDGRHIRIRASDAEEHKKYRVQGSLHLAAGVVKATGGNKNSGEYVLVSPLAKFKVTFRHDSKSGSEIKWNPSVE